VAWWPEAARQPQAARWAECTYIDVTLLLRWIEMTNEETGFLGLTTNI
jgi:hypothetical protein